MDDVLLHYYERELSFVRELGAQFAKKYPKIAGRLMLEADKCEDPHTERLIEAFAFLCGRIHLKIDDGFPQLTEALFSIIYPHYINPIPAMTVVAFDPVRQTVSPSGYTIPKGAALYSKLVSGAACQFTCAYPVHILPLEVKDAGMRSPRNLKDGVRQSLWLQLGTFNSLGMHQLKMDCLRFYLGAAPQHVFHLYELIFNHAVSVDLVVKNAAGLTQVITLGKDRIAPVGFDPSEAVLPFTPRSFPGYQVLFEYFCYPEKFLFFDLLGCSALKELGELGETLEIWINLDRFAKPNVTLNADTFCLHAAPAVNLFSRIAEPIRVEHRHSEYQVLPDLRRQDALEVYSIDKVVATAADEPGKFHEIKPFYSLRHDADKDGARNAYWLMQRRASGRKGDNGTDVYLSFADLDFEPGMPEVEVVTVHATCTNRDLPGRLPFGDRSGDFSLEKTGPVAKVRCLFKPCSTRRPSLGGALQWRLLSHLGLNYLSLVEGGETALKEVLRLYDFDNSPSTRQQIDGIVAVSSKHVTRRLGRCFCRGIQARITFDEDKFVGSGYYLFAAVLEHFLAQYVSLNSFSQLEITTMQNKETVKRWPPRNGNRILL